MESDPLLLWFVAGLGISVAAHRLASLVIADGPYGHRYSQQKRGHRTGNSQDDRTPLPKRTEDVLSLSSLEQLTKCENIFLQESAIRLLLDRAMSDEHLPDILRACKSSNEDLQKMAVATVQQMTKHEDNRRPLVRAGVLKILTQVISSKNEASRRYAIVALYRLVSSHDKRKVKIVQYGVLDPLLGFLLSSPSHSNDIKYWSLLLIHQFCLTEKLHSLLIERDIVPTLGLMTRLTFGNSNMQKLCLHSLVRLISTMPNAEGAAQLSKLLDLNMLSFISSCLRSDDMELVSWTVFLLHEFVIKDVARNEITKLPGMIKILVNLFSAEEQCIPRIILRMLKCLGIRNESVQMEMIKAGVVGQAIPLLRSTDEETRYWAVLLLHDLAAPMEGNEEFMRTNGLQVLISLADKVSNHLALYIADIFVYLCSSVTNHNAILDSDFLQAVLHFCKSEDTDLQYAGAALLLNIATMSYAMVRKIVSQGGMDWLMEIVLSSEMNENTAIVASKTLTSMTMKDPSLLPMIISSTLSPLTQKFISTATFCVDSFVNVADDAEGSASPSASSLAKRSPLSATLPDTPTRRLSPMLFSSPTAIRPSRDSATANSRLNQLLCLADCLAVFLDARMRDETTQLDMARCVLDLLSLPLIDEWSPPTSSVGVLSPEDFEPGGTEKPVDPSSPVKKERKASWAGEEKGLAIATSSLKSAVASHVLLLVPPLFRIDEIREFMFENKLIRMLVNLIDMGGTELSYAAIAALSTSIANYPVSHSELHAIPDVFDLVVRKLHLEAGYSTAAAFFAFHANAFLHRLAGHMSSDHEELPDSSLAVLDMRTKTPRIRVSPSYASVSNESWTFESAMSNICVSGSGKYAYEVHLRSDGIVQVGWADEDAASAFDPEAGTGVGDDNHSYACDGHRKKKWHGIAPIQNTYGTEWARGDVITALLDLDAGEISYLHNGRELGPAFTDVPTTRDWYPAISLASGQLCTVHFGDSLFPLKYLPSDYSSIHSFAVKKANDDSNVTSEVMVPITRSYTMDHFVFEAKISKGSLANGFLQFGVTVPQSNLLVAALYDDGRNIHFVLTRGVNPEGSEYSKSLAKLVFGANSQEGWTVLTSMTSTLRDGDVLRAFVTDGKLFFSRNMCPFGMSLDLDRESSVAVFPYIRSNYRFVVSCEVPEDEA
ncbi:armadillo-type protein [Cladochytrium replicatum]|nr:armadillo-type protein [Cladochytrium replicatum]